MIIGRQRRAEAAARTDDEDARQQIHAADPAVGGGSDRERGRPADDAAVAATCEMLAAAMPLLFRFLDAES